MKNPEQDEDFLDEIIREGVERDPEFPQLLAAAERARALIRRLTQARVSAGLSQVQVARGMKTSQPAVARLEAGESDPRLSTVERYAGVVGERLVTNAIVFSRERNRREAAASADELVGRTIVADWVVKWTFASDAPTVPVLFSASTSVGTAGAFGGVLFSRQSGFWVSHTGSADGTDFNENGQVAALAAGC